MAQDRYKAPIPTGHQAVNTPGPHRGVLEASHGTVGHPLRDGWALAWTSLILWAWGTRGTKVVMGLVGPQGCQGIARRKTLRLPQGE